MLRVTAVLLTAGLLAACGTNEEDRAISGAGIGAAGGALLGPVGLLAGAGVGAATGAVTESDDINLGEPVWND